MRFKWECTCCGATKFNGDMIFEGESGDVCERCYSDEQYEIFKKDIDFKLIELWSRIGIDKPTNHDEILDYICMDIEACTDKDSYNDDDFLIGYRRWMESD